MHAEVREPVSVALIGRRDEARTQLQNALTEFGASVVFEGEPADVDLGALQRVAPGVVIVNLDAATEDALDRLQAVLDDPSINVIFNEAEVTSQLGGWDLARWARHLAAKVLGHQDTNPPAPADAERLPQSHFMPRPGAPPTPAEMAGERMIEEFTVEADDHADAIPTDYMPMEVLSAATPEAHADPSLGIDFDAIEDAMTLANAPAPTVSGAAVPDSARLDEDAPIDFGVDLSVLDAALTTPAAEQRSVPADAAALIDPALSEFDFELATDPDDSTATDAAADPTDAIDLADAGLEGDDGLDVAFARFDADETEYQHDDDVARMAAQLEELAPGTLPSANDEVDEFDFGTVSVQQDVAPGGDDDTLQLDSIDLDGGFDEGANDSASATALATATSAAISAIAAAPAAAFDFGALELAPLDGEDAAGSAPAAAPAVKRSFDLGALSLEPMGDEDAASVAVDVSGDAIQRVIVLGASIGGPDALRGFLSHIPEGFPALFVLAQHLDNGFFERLAQQLQKSARIPVRVAQPGQPAAHGEVLVIPADTRVLVEPDGSVGAEPHPEAPRYSPSIDNVMRDVADRFGARATAVVFSGMAGDAIEGSVYLTSKGGEVWAQTPDSCVVSSMVDGASARGVVEFFGTPRELADRCVARYGR